MGKGIHLIGFPIGRNNVYGFSNWPPHLALWRTCGGRSFFGAMRRGIYFIESDPGAWGFAASRLEPARRQPGNQFWLRGMGTCRMSHCQRWLDVELASTTPAQHSASVVSRGHLCGLSDGALEWPPWPIVDPALALSWPCCTLSSSPG